MNSRTTSVQVPSRRQVDYQLCCRALRSFSPMSDAALQRIEPSLRARELARGQALLQEGEHARDVVIVERGWLREYYLLSNGDERTKAFVFEGDVSGSLADLLSGAGSTAYIVAESDTRVVCFPFSLYRTLCTDDPEWRSLHLAGLELLFLRKARREYELLGLDAAARYRALLERSPQIEQRVSAKHIASYLGITPVHLSRLRRRRA